jgi:DNA-binding CsgD family transcriptional regulator
MSRLFAESGGVVGVAAALVDAGRREGRLINRDGSWAAPAGLCSPSLTGLAERLLDGVEEEDRATAEVMALLGTTDLETVIALRGAASVGRLEAQGVARIAAVGDRRIATLMPPLLAAHCRATAPEGVRRLLDGGLGGTAERPASSAERAAEDQALLVHLVHARAAEARAAAEAQWSRRPDATTAVARLTALLADGAASDIVASAFADALAVDGDAADRARIAALHARWRVEQGTPLDTAVAELRASAGGFEEHAGIAEAAAVALEVEMRGVPHDAEERLALADGLPQEVTAALLEAWTAVLVARGRLLDAAECLADREALPVPVDQRLAALRGFLLLGTGRHAEASTFAAHGLRAAWSELDAAAIRAHGFLAGLCQVIAGQYAAADESLSRILALGEAGPLDRSDELGILALATLAAARRGDAATGEQRQARIAASPAAGSVMGRVAAAWSSAQLLAYRGRMAEAAHALAAHADDMHRDGVDLWSAWSLINAIEVSPDGTLSDLAEEWLSGMQAEHLSAHFAFLQARDAGLPDQMLAVIPRLQATGRSGLGVVAYRLAAERLRAIGELEEAARADAEREAFIARLPRRAFDATRFNATAVNLTGREREISRLVAGGLSNPQIASRLVLSVRTVESHLHRIMRKTGTANRGELAAYVRSLAA